MNNIDKIKKLNNKINNMEKLTYFLLKYNDDYPSITITTRDINGGEVTIVNRLSEMTIRKIMSLIKEERDALKYEIESTNLVKERK